MQTLDFVLIALAAYYVVVVLSNDLIAGPANILTTLRQKMGLQYNELGAPEYDPGSLADLIMCPYCSSIWIALILVAVFAGLSLADLPARWLFAPLAIGGLVVLIQELKK